MNKLRKNQLTLALLVVVFVLGVIFISRSNSNIDEVPINANFPVVELITPLEYSGTQSVSLIGTARAASEAQITSERAGRVTTVNVSLGQTVVAGQIIGTIDNASERAALLQAEGVYDAAIAASAQNDLSVEQAQINVTSARNNAVSAFQSAYNTSNNVVRNSIDQFFANPDARVPGLRIDGRGYTMSLNNERVAYQTLLLAWQDKANSINIDSELEVELDYAKDLVKRTISFIDTFITVFSNQTRQSSQTESELQAYISSFTNLRTSLISVESNINAALSGLATTDESLRQAELGSSGSTASGADAQVKQALGALRSAEANLAKTIFRTPIGGTVDELLIRPGDFINSFSLVATVANNNTLEIITYISDDERPFIAIDDEVIINESAMGRVSEISPSINSSTGKIEVRIVSDDPSISAGETVRISKRIDLDRKSDVNIQVPLSAVKFEATDGFVFTVVEGKLVAKSVTLGVIRGNSVEILDGILATEQIVRDTRGLNNGETVQISE